jgi:two-component system, response regulator
MMELNKVEIYVIEDSYEDFEMTLRAFRKRKLTNRIVHLDDGEFALDYMLAHSESISLSSLIVLDLNLPKVSGLEILEKLKSHERLRYIPVVVMTSSKENRDLKAAYNLGVNSYIVKPVVFEDFISCVGNIGLYWTLLNVLPTESEDGSRL